MDRTPDPFGRYVQAWIEGTPPEGPIDFEYPNPPDRTAPIGLGPHPVDTPVQFTVAPGGASIAGVLAAIVSWDHGQTGRLIGRAVASEIAPLEYELRVPPLPSTSDAGSVFVSSMQLQLATCHPGADGYCESLGVEAWEASPPGQ